MKTMRIRPINFWLKYKNDSNGDIEINNVCVYILKHKT
jgi:hypothetical protein